MRAEWTEAFLTGFFQDASNNSIATTIPKVSGAKVVAKNMENDKQGFLHKAGDKQNYRPVSP